MIVQLSLNDLVRCLDALRFKRTAYKKLGNKGELAVENCSSVISRVETQIKKETFKPKSLRV